MDVQRVFVKPDKKATVRCHACGLVRVVSLKNIADLKPRMNVKCNCGDVFPIKFEYRKFYRKGTELNGVYQKIYSGTSTDLETLATMNKVNCRVDNVSMHGAGFTILGNHMVQKGERVGLGFNLDNSAKTWVAKSGVVRVVDGNYIGMEFDEAADKYLGFYLMP